MRDFVLGPIILAIVGYALTHPWIGIIGWTWISIMSPQSYSWRLNSMPVAAAVAAATLLGVLVTRDRRQFLVSHEMVVLMMFMVWMTITLVFAFRTGDSYYMWNRVMKIDLMVLVALIVLHSKRHITILVWTLVGSLGLLGVKGGLFTLATGGAFRVWGPPGSFIEGNNEIALALVMIIPLMQYLRLTTESAWIKRTLLASMVLCALAALGSQSRGALVSIGAMVAVMWWRSNKKAGAAVLLLVASLALLSFMPQAWWDRMGTISTYEEDTSALGRLNAWWMAFNLAKENFFGGGFAIYNGVTFALYAPDPTDVHAAHSIYFMVLGEHGFVGLTLFLLLWILVWRSAGRLRTQGRQLSQTMWLSHLGAMCQVSLAGYAVGGAFLSLSYYDLPYNILILGVLGCRWMDNKEWVIEADQEAKRQVALAAKADRRSR